MYLSKWQFYSAFKLIGNKDIILFHTNYCLPHSHTGLESDSLLITGFLSHSEVTQYYTVRVPYISDPFVTMAETSREIARRFTEVGGPSFFVSFLGQDSLSDVIEVNVTFDGSLDWSAAVPELAYWDVGEGVCGVDVWVCMKCMVWMRGCV